MTEKDPKDLLREIKADIEGIDAKDICFKDLRKKEKSRKKKEKIVESENKSDMIGNQEGFSLTDAGTSFCEYKDIGKKRILKDKKTLEEWGAFDFFRFTHDLYLKKYKVNWDLNLGGGSLEINRIRDKFYDLFGFCCNLIMRDYIIFSLIII